MNKKIGWALIVALMVTGVALEPAWGVEKGWYLGGGFSSQNLSGGFDGNFAYCSDSQCSKVPVLLPGKAKSGSGINLLGGYQINSNIGIEYLSSSTIHESTHVLKKEADPLSVVSGLFGIRVGAGIDLFNFFLRMGLASTTLSYDKASWVGGDSWEEVSFTGSGIGYGVGIAYQPTEWGVEFAYNQHNTRLDSLKAGNFSGRLEQPVSLKVASLTVSVVYHFK